MYHNVITVKKNDAGQRLDKFLEKLMPSMPKSMIYKLIRKKDIRYQKKRCQGNEILQVGDEITIYAKEEFFKPKTEKFSELSRPSNLQICYEDDNFLIVYKPVGQDVHSGSQKQSFTSTLIDEIQNYLYAKGEYIPEQEQSFKPSLCNRIDRNTEGLVISAKNALALRTMNEAIRLRQVDKLYLAITAKPLPKLQDTCIAWLKKDTKHNHVTVLDYQPDKNWQKICTQYKIIAQHDKKQLVKINLLTGRTHQIRSHLAYLHAPLLGEKKYISNSKISKTNTKSANYQCLCAYEILFSGITSPELQYLENIKITAPIPEFVKIYFPEIKKL